MMKHELEKAIHDVREGRMVLIYDFDDREKETDLVLASEFMTPEGIREMRKSGGGLICATAHNDIVSALDLPFLAEVFACSAKEHSVMDLLTPNDIPYDTKSAFSITINHRHTFTGITDRDRALTITEFAKLAKKVGKEDAEALRQEFGGTFRAPGHVHLLNSSRELLAKRFGHTELSTALMVMAGVTPSATLCEMMGDDGNALGKEEARRYAKDKGLAFLEGKDIVEAWKNGGRPE
jgi:3,4-dihydroxy 2-butanone 4-phosphate synthase